MRVSPLFALQSLTKLLPLLIALLMVASGPVSIVTDYAQQCEEENERVEEAKLEVEDKLDAAEPRLLVTAHTPSRYSFIGPVRLPSRTSGEARAHGSFLRPLRT